MTNMPLLSPATSTLVLEAYTPPGHLVPLCEPVRHREGQLLRERLDCCRACIGEAGSPSRAVSTMSLSVRPCRRHISSITRSQSFAGVNSSQDKPYRTLAVFSTPNNIRKPSVRTRRMFGLSHKSPPPKIPQPERLDEVYEALKRGLQVEAEPLRFSQLILGFIRGVVLLLLFNACMDWVFSKVVGSSSCGTSVGKERFLDLDFAHDAVKFAMSMEFPIGALKRLNEES
ncbi:RIPR1 regulator, partial [Polypterus senegalus]